MMELTDVIKDSERQIVLLRRAYHSAWRKSHDPSTKNGAIMLSEAGTSLVRCNAFPEGIDPDAIADRETKLKYILHAEEHVLVAAAREGIPTLGAVMVCPWAACVQCARLIVAAGVSTLIVHRPALLRTPDRWRDAVADGLILIEDSGIQLIKVENSIGNVSALMDGEVWLP